IAQGDHAHTLQGNQNKANVGHGNILVDGHGHTVIIQKASTEKRPRLEHTLLDEVAKEVSYRRQQSLHNQVFIELGKEQAANQVSCPWAMEVKVGKQAPEPISDGQTIANVFERPDIAGKLLILGQPGAGKTTTLLDLAKDLVILAQQDMSQPIPVLFNLSSWQDDKQTIAQWLVKELREKYQVREAKGQELMEAKKLLPLLDGLDELAAQRQKECVKAINTWLGSDLGASKVTICSRIQEYKTYKTVLTLNGAICLQPLKKLQIERYLQQTGKTELWSVVSQDETVVDLVRVPLWLSVLTLARNELDLAKWSRLNTDQDRLTLLLDAYVRARLAEPLSEKNCKQYKPTRVPTAKQTRRWLVWLAQNIEQDEFLIERMQPTLLTTHSEKWQMRLIFGVIGGLTGSLIGGLILGLILGLIWGLIGGLIWGLIEGLIEGLHSIDTVEILKSHFSHVTRFSLKTLIWSLIWGLVWSLILGPIWGLVWSLILGLILGLIWGLIESLICGLIEGCKADIQTQVQPNQGILNSGRNTVFLLAMAIPAAGLVLWLLPLGLTLVPSLDEQQIAGIVGAGVVALFLRTWKYGGGDAYLRHYALRFILARSGKIPYLYANFLNYCTERLLLQRVGGRFRFLHRTLQEHFAAMPLEDYRQGMKP
ncbi:NACHT domain-containing protein, partial [Leptolyngbya cf. ectocarpi LEGE 11479]